MAIAKSPFKTVGTVKYVDIFAIEVYLPYDYLEKAYRGLNYYSLVGTKVKYFGVGNMRFFNNQKEMDSPVGVPVYTLGIPMIITGEPTDIDTREVQFTSGGPSRKCIVLTFYKNDEFLCNTDAIKGNDNVMIYLTRLLGGKLNHVSPEEAVGILQDVQKMNGIKLRIPSEEEEIFIAERYRSDRDPSKKARLIDSTNPDKIVSLNMRQEAMKSTTYQALTHEDVNTSLISSVNRIRSGIVDKPTPVEIITRGLDTSEMVRDRDRRLAQEQHLRHRDDDTTTESEG